MSATQTFVCRIIGTKLHGIFFRWLKKLIIAMFWRHDYFLLKVKNSQENICKESYFKKWLFKNVTSETLFCQLISSMLWELTKTSVFLLGTKGILKSYSLDMVELPCWTFWHLNWGLKIMLILVSECNVRNMESPITFFFKGFEPRLMATLVIR